MNTDELSPAALTREKSLTEIYFKSIKIRETPINLIVSGTFFVILAVFAFSSQQKAGYLGDLLRNIAASGTSLTTSVLGFLLAGYTIFITITDQNLFIALAKQKKDDYEFSWLKFIVFVFMRVFIYYLVGAILFFTIQVFFTQNGIFSSFMVLIGIPEQVKIFIIKFLIVSCGTFVIYLLMSLKSFIFNIYEVSMMTIRWHYEKEEQTV
jgi:hypothetical protein